MRSNNGYGSLFVGHKRCGSDCRFECSTSYQRTYCCCSCVWLGESRRPNVSDGFFVCVCCSLFCCHAARAGKVIGVGVHIYICMSVDQKKIFLNNTRSTHLYGRTSRRIYRPALPLLSPEPLSLSSKSRIFLYNAQLALFVRMDDTITRTNASVSISSFSKL